MSDTQGKIVMTIENCSKRCLADKNATFIILTRNLEQHLAEKDLLKPAWDKK
jgi:hypothetical protein